MNLSIRRYSLRCLLEFFNLGRENEIILTQTVDIVSPDAKPSLAPRQTDFWMVTLLFREVADAISEVERFFEIFEGVVFLEVVFIHHFPAFCQLLGEFPYVPSF